MQAHVLNETVSVLQHVYAKQRNSTFSPLGDHKIVCVLTGTTQPSRKTLLGPQADAFSPSRTDVKRLDGTFEVFVRVDVEEQMYRVAA